MIYLNLLGLALNFTGSLLIAFSIIKNPGEAHQLIQGRKIYLTSILLNKFRWGIGLFVFGFLLQLIVVAKDLLILI